MSVHTLQQLVKDISNNRWMNEFAQGEKIGKGGFASVYKAKNHSDKTDYAVKKIKLHVNGLKGNVQEDLERVLTEATSLARFNHDNIVKYYNSWLEIGTKPKELAKPQQSKNKGGWREISIEDEEESEDISTYDSFGDLDSSAVVFDRSGEDESEDNHFIFEESVDCSQSTAEQSSHDPSILNHGAQFSDTRQKEPVKIVDSILEALSEGLAKDEVIDKIEFFIQTELCNGTLGDYIAARNKKLTSLQAKNPEAYKEARKEYLEEAIAFAKQILEGLALIHGEGIIHRDLKPQNIFLLNKVCKIGDFGLIKMNDSQTSPKNPSKQQQGDKPKEDSRGAVGTRMFASPEQWEGDDENVDFSADIFSLGITFLLMFYPMGTTMEELQVISESKKGNLPSNLEKDLPEIAMMIKKMLAADPCDRPSLEIVLSHFKLCRNSH